MNLALLVVASTISQCPPVCYSEPICVQPCPNPSIIREKVYFPGEVRSRCIVEAVLSNGKRITVPVINGYTPAIKVTIMSDGSQLREYDYYDRDVYKGGVISYGKSEPRQQKTVTIPRPKPPSLTEERTSIPQPVPYEEDKKPKYMPRYTDDDFEAIQKNMKELQEAIRVLQQKEDTERPPITLQADPQKLEHQPPNLKKPSDFGRE